MTTGLEKHETEVIVRNLRNMRLSVVRIIEKGDEAFTVPHDKEGRETPIECGLLALAFMTPFEEELKARGITAQGEEFGPDVRAILGLT